MGTRYDWKDVDDRMGGDLDSTTLRGIQILICGNKIRILVMVDIDMMGIGQSGGTGSD